ncbi:ABC transporter substrate-binding protein [Nonomuraea sp. bgisy101]|uniref:ABC transporter substrate-binding protein n=1 Tax=Nonomuraea sp. bgisy101 TaxID=3413784 RepID=UPI003D73AF80
MRALRPGDPHMVGAYQVTGFLGEGGQGSVYLGLAPSGEPVAIKMLHARFADDASAVRRFRREAEAARRVAEFCTAKVLEVGALDDQPYIVSEFVDGPSLQRQVAESGPLTGASLVRLAVTTATALAAIHRAGVVHRDFKPSNVLLAADGPRVIDFGIARALDMSQSLTTSVVGTPAYMAPEQFHGDTTPAGDVFSWAGTMAYAATGRGAFGFGSLPVVMHRILALEPDLSGVGEPLRELLWASLAKDPAARPTAEQLVRALIGFGSGAQAPVPAPPYPPLPHGVTPATAPRYPHGPPAPLPPARYPVSGAVAEKPGRWPKVLVPIGAAAMTVLLGVAVWAWPRTNADGGGQVTPQSAPTHRPAAFNAALTGVVAPSTRKGGTLRIGTTAALDDIDPANSFNTELWNYGRLYGRSLTMYRPAPGAAGTEVVPDLAEKLGETSDDGRTWTFTLRDGLLFEDGTPITSADVKYAVMRSADRELMPNGTDAIVRLLDMPGAYTAADAGKAISTPDARTVVFRLKHPMSSFNQLATLPVTMPVRMGSTKPLSSGPYKVGARSGTSVTLVRNAHWSGAGDPHRTALPDRVELTWNMNAEEAGRKLLSGELEVMSTPASATLDKVRADPALNVRSDAPSMNFLRFLAVNTRLAPLDRAECRKAVLAAVDRAALHRVYGDGPFGTEIATRLQPPSMPGRGELDDPRPLASAARPPESCGKVSFTLLTRDGETDVSAGNVIRDNLAAAGIEVTVKNVPLLEEIDTLGNPAAHTKQKVGLVMRRWSPDWPDADPMLSPLIDSREIVESGFSTNLGVRLTQVDRLIDQSRRTLDPEARARTWRQAERLVLEEGLVLPLLWIKGGLIRGKGATNVHVSAVYHDYDVTTMGVAP